MQEQPGQSTDVSLADDPDDCASAAAIPMNQARHAPSLRRVLTLWPLVFYGLGVIVGAGIYVAIGAVMRRAGESAPLSFLLAGATAGLTGICYAELASRFPEASGGVAYV